MYESKVDSCRLSIPLKECTVKNDQLTDLVTTIKYVEDTGVHIKTTSKVSEPIVIESNNGTYFKVYLDSQLNYVNGQRITESYLTILVNSKLLQKEYFKGITKDTFQALYNYVMSTDTFSCSYESFKNARYNDTDICFDFISSIPEFNQLHKSLKISFINPSLLHSVSKADNLGMWTPSAKQPRQQATPSKPYIKFYSKELDMTYNSTAFAQAYLQPSDYTNVFRFECTIGNSKHKKRLGISSIKTIWELLNTDLQSIVQSMVKEYIDKPRIVKSKAMTPSKEHSLNQMRLNIKLGATLEDVRATFELDTTIHNRVTINKYKELYYELLKHDSIDLETIQNNQSTVSIFEYLGIKKG
jgi:hypothetical protein|tara:strand:+ start:286 stop:1356 length:1071 start_codon:yes stop_codon:yes gene_type:complete